MVHLRSIKQPKHWSVTTPVRVPASTSVCVPAGTVVSFLLTPTRSGVNSAMEAWGRDLRNLHNTTRNKADIVVSKLGYWTDKYVTCTLAAPIAIHRSSTRQLCWFMTLFYR